jgi:hypothetical protein
MAAAVRRDPHESLKFTFNSQWTLGIDEKWAILDCTGEATFMNGFPRRVTDNPACSSMSG